MSPAPTQVIGIKSFSHRTLGFLPFDWFLSGDDDTAVNMEDIDVEVLKEVVHEVVMNVEDHKEQLIDKDKVTKIKSILFIYIHRQMGLVYILCTSCVSSRGCTLANNPPPPRKLGDQREIVG